MFTPFTQNDKEFVENLVSKGFTEKQALDFLFDFQLEMQMETNNCEEMEQV